MTDDADAFYKVMVNRVLDAKLLVHSCKWERVSRLKEVTQTTEGLNSLNQWEITTYVIRCVELKCFECGAKRVAHLSDCRCSACYRPDW